MGLYKRLGLPHVVQVKDYRPSMVAWCIDEFGIPLQWKTIGCNEQVVQDGLWAPIEGAFYVYFSFKRPNDALFFKLRWVG